MTLEQLDINLKDVIATFKLLGHEKETEIRCLDPFKQKPPVIRFVNSEEQFVKVVSEYNGKYNIYAGINERRHNGTTNEDVIAINNIVIDLDPIRISNTPTTDEELAKADALADIITERLVNYGYNKPIKAMSGNGIQLWCPVSFGEIDNDRRDFIQSKIKQFYKKLNGEFYNDAVNVDEIGDLSRVIKVIGTKSIKGIESLDRPHRVSKFLTIPERKVDYKLTQDIKELTITNNFESKANLANISQNGFTPKKHEQQLFEVACDLAQKDLDYQHIWNILKPLDAKDPTPQGDAKLDDCIKMALGYRERARSIPPTPISKLNEKIGQIAIQKKESHIFTELSQPLEYAQYIMNDCNYIFKTLTDTKEILVYLENEGVYSYDGQTLIEHKVQQLAGILCSNRLVGEVIGHIKRSTPFKHELLNNDFSKLVLQDGILNLDTLEFNKGFNPEFYTTVKIPVKYDTKATCPKFIKHLKDSLGTSENIIRVVEGMANILTANRKTFEMMYIFHGSGSNGKSVILKIIRGVIGDKNCSSMSIHSVAEERFAGAHLDGKLVNLGGEISDNELNKTARLKQFTSYESIMVEKKGKDPFEMVAFAKHFYSTNKMPNIRDDTDSIYRRITTIKFETQFLPGVNRIEDYDKEILKEEASGIFNLMLQNYKTLLKNRGFRHRQTIGEVREIMKNEADRLRQFVSNCLVLKCEGKFIIKDTMYEKIGDYFRSNNYDFDQSKQAISLELSRLGLTDKHEGKDVIKKVNGKAVRVWVNVAWDMSNDWVKSNIKPEVKATTKDESQVTL